MAQNYKVAGAKMSQQFHNHDPQPMRRADVIAMMKAYNMPLGEICHSKPSTRRWKAAMKKVDAGVDGTGRFERKVINQELCERMQHAEHQYYGHP